MGYGLLYFIHNHNEKQTDTLTADCKWEELGGGKKNGVIIFEWGFRRIVFPKNMKRQNIGNEKLNGLQGNFDLPLVGNFLQITVTM